MTAKPPPDAAQNSVPACHPSLRHELSQALGAEIAERGTVQVARLVGISHDSVGRHGSDLSAWRWEHGLRLCAVMPSLNTVAQRCHTGMAACVQPNPVHLPVSLREAVRESAEAIAAMVASPDGHHGDVKNLVVLQTEIEQARHAMSTALGQVRALLRAKGVRL